MVLLTRIGWQSPFFARAHFFYHGLPGVFVKKSWSNNPLLDSGIQRQQIESLAMPRPDQAKVTLVKREYSIRSIAVG